MSASTRKGRSPGRCGTRGSRSSASDVDRRRPIQAVRRLAEVLRRLRPELVQSFLFHANVASRLAAPLAGRPWVVGGLRVAERRNRWHLGLDRLTSRLALGSVCVSKGVMRHARDHGRISPERLIVIPNAVDPAPFDLAEPADRAALGVPEGSTLALFVGRLDGQKGLQVLLDAAAKVIRSDPRWHLALVGDGPDRDLVTKAVASPELAGRVRWLGRRDDVPALLKAADLLVLPSLWEGMPNVVLEAMAARRAVVATAVEGTEDLVVPGETGWLVPPADPDALAAALDRRRLRPRPTPPLRRGRPRPGRDALRARLAWSTPTSGSGRACSATSLRRRAEAGPGASRSPPQTGCAIGS